MKIIGEKLSNSEMLNVKGGSFTCQCLHNVGVFECDTLADCQATVNWACVDGSGSDAACSGFENPTVQ